MTGAAVRLERALIRDAEQEAAQGARDMRGRLRLSMPATMGRRWISPMLADFALAHPQVALEVEYSERIADVVTGGINKVPGVRGTRTHLAFRAYSTHDLEAAFSLGE